MKKITFLLLVNICFLAAYCQVPTNGLVAWYPFNGNANDSSGFGNNGAVNGATLTTDRFGKPNGAYLFNGTSNYILVPPSSSIEPPNSLTVSVWFNATSNSNQWQPLISKHISSSFPYDSYLLGTGTPSPVNNKYYGVISDGNTISKNAISKNSSYSDWVFLTFTYDGSSIKSYTNGILDTTNSFSSNIGYNSSVGLYIGHNGIGSQFFKGVIDEITIHNIALSDSEVSNYYQTTKPTPNVRGLIAHYKLDGNGADSSGNFNHGSIVGSVSPTIDRFGSSNSAMSFNGSGYISVPHSNGNSPRTSMSVSAWVNANGPISDWLPVLCKRRSTSSDPYDSYTLSTAPASYPVNGKWFFGSANSSGGGNKLALSKNNSSTSVWTHITGTWDGNIMKMYINGMLDTSITFTGTIGYNTGLGLYIGYNTSQYYKGIIDDIRIYDYALNINQVGTLYKQITNNSITGDPTVCYSFNPILQGTLPKGGMDTNNYTYSWISSTLSATEGYSPATGVNNLQNYSSGNIYVPTWYKRIVYSGNSIDTSAAFAVSLKAKPLISIAVNNSNQCVNANSFLFTDNTTYSSSFTRLWNLGLGSNDTTRSANPTKSYNVSGSYNITYLAVADNGCRDSSSIVINVGSMPSVGFSSNNTSQCQGYAFIFSDTSKAINGSLVREWNFGAGPFDISTQINPTKNYSNPGTYSVKLKVNNYGCIDSASKSVIVFAKPNPGFTVNNAVQCITNNNFAFADTTTFNNANRKWSFGNGDTANIANPNIVFNQPNTYTVKLILTSNNGCKDSVSKNVSVSAKPNPGFIINNASQCINGNSFVLYDTSKVDLGLLSRTWFFGDGGSSSTSPVTKSYSNAGNYSIKLVVSNSGCRDSVTQSVSVNPKPIVGFTLNNATQCFKEQLFTLSDTSTIVSGSYNRTWYMGDATLTSSNPVYKTYNGVGNYTIKLVLNSDKGCKDSVSKSVTVNASPNAGFTINNASQCLNTNSFSFMDTSNISAGSINRIWYYDNLQSTATNNPLTKTYSSSNTYSVKLVISSNKGCKDSVSKNIVVNPLPIVSISTSTLSDNVCNGSSISLSGNGANSYSWDNGISNGVSFTPSSSKTYTVTGTDQNGCVGVASKTIKLNPLPIVTIRASANAVCAGSTLTLNGEGAVNYAWNGGVVNGLPFNPSSTNTYTVTGSDSNGCANTASKSITVNPLPNVIANASADPICAGSSTTLYGSGATTYTWSGGVTNNVAFTPSATATYTVTGIDANNCSNTASKTITVNPLPNITVSINGWTISSNETGPALYQWINCSSNQAIGGAINKTYTASANGSYAVIVSKNNCSDTSSCITFSNVGVDENTAVKYDFSVYPNPNNGTFDIKSHNEGDYIIINELGQSVTRFNLTKDANYHARIENLSRGMYFILGDNENTSGVKLKFIVE